eukprot:8478950-Alexandrium_andersonii.AAC.1
MSASLVGSEMCIRDRDTTAQTLPTPQRARRNEHQAQLPFGCRLQPGPVSYTHLTLPTICSV